MLSITIFIINNYLHSYLPLLILYWKINYMLAHLIKIDIAQKGIFNCYYAVYLSIKCSVADSRRGVICPYHCLYCILLYYYIRRNYFELIYLVFSFELLVSDNVSTSVHNNNQNVFKKYHYFITDKLSVCTLWYYKIPINYKRGFTLELLACNQTVLTNKIQDK